MKENIEQGLKGFTSLNHQIYILLLHHNNSYKASFKRGVMQKRIFSQRVTLVIIASLLLFPIISAAVQDDFLQLINAERAAQGVAPLTISSELTQAAQLHSQDMMNNNYFSHNSPNGPNGNTSSQRILATGYIYQAAGENIAWHSGQVNATRVFDQWMNSPPHYANMISSNFQELGLGFATGSPFQSTSGTATVYTLDLGRRSSPPTPVCTQGQNQTQSCGSSVGVCEQGSQARTCNSNGQWNSWGSCQGAITPTTEVCNDQLDNDCDGNTDESCPTPSCSPGQNQTQQCGITNVGICELGSRSRTCDNNNQWNSWTSCQGAINPATEVCNDQLDNDCDGNTDESCPAPQCTSGQQESRPCGIDTGMCEFGAETRSCLSNSQWSSWSSCIGAINPVTEICDSQDNDCDSQTDENQICEPLSIQIQKPTDNQQFFIKTILVNASLNKRSQLLNIYDNTKKIAICSNCASFQKTFSFTTGAHNLLIEAFDENNNRFEDTISFEVIISDLNLLSIDPRTNRDYIGRNAQFNISYNSDLPVQAQLIIQSPSFSQTLTQNCPVTTSRAICSLTTTIPENINEKANLSYRITDVTGTFEEKNGSATLDTLNPILTTNITTINGLTTKRVRVKGTITENSKVEYLNQEGEWKRICSNCDSFLKTFTIPIFSSFNTQFRVTDKAGNQILEIIEE